MPEKFVYWMLNNHHPLIPENRYRMFVSHIFLSKSQSCSFIFMTCHHIFDGTNTTGPASGTRGKIHIIYTYIHVYEDSLSWLSAGISMKSGGAKLVMWAFPLSVMMWSC
jgi:hypothetical protein